MTVRKAYAETPAGQMHYRHQPGAGDPVIFLHRTPVCSSSFERVFAELAGWRPLYAFDTPGFGNSFTPRTAACIEAFRDWFIAALDSLGIDRFHLYGHHTGSHFAIEIAAEHPARARSLIIDGGMYISNEDRARRKAARAPTPPIDQDGAYIGQGWAFLKTYYPRFVPDIVHREFVGAMRSLPTRDICIDAILDQDFRRALRRVSCPIHACAAEDDVYAALLAQIAADLPDVTTSLYGKAGIAGPELQPEALARIIRAHVMAD